MSNQGESSVYGETFEVRFVWGKQRHYPRYPLDAPVEFVVEGMLPVEPRQAEGHDISLGGVGMLTPDAEEQVPQVGARVRVQVMIEGFKEPLIADGIVVHSTPRRGFGVRFLNLTTSLRTGLKRLLTSKVSG